MAKVRATARFGIPKYLQLTEAELHRMPAGHRRNSILYYRQLTKATPKWADKDKIRAIYQKAAELRAMGVNVIVEHTVPVKSKIVCGLHVDYNLEIRTPLFNIQKGNHWWPDCPMEQADFFNSPFETEQYALPLPLYKSNKRP